MMKHGIKYTFLSLILVMAMLFSPVVPAIRLHQLSFLWQTMSVTPAQAQETGENTIYLPLVTVPTAPPGPPAFEIINPANGGTISGMMYFAVQPTELASIEHVTFMAGSTDIGTDSTPDDGLRVFLDASDFSEGELELSAVATGPSGETTKSITVNVVPNPPSSATVGEEGGVLASEIGSVITILPDSVPDGTNITVTEKTQEQVTADNGFDWDAMGVTFLGAQEIQSTEPFSKPVGMVASAGFGPRVQPGQAVVNYRIAPDADGDGVDELIVINTASVAPNDDVISDPVPQVQVSSATTRSRGGSTFVRHLNGGISGPPGATIEIEASGFNPASVYGNVAVWTSLVDGETFEVSGLVLPDPTDNSQQIFSTVIPPLSVGQATLMLRNESTGSTAGPFDVTIETPESLSGTAEEIIDRFLTDTINYLNDLPTSPEEEAAISTAVMHLTEAQSRFQELIKNGPTPEEQQALNDLALLIQNSSVYTVEANHSLAPSGYDLDAIVNDALTFVGGFSGVVGAIATVAGSAILVKVAAGLLIAYGVGTMALYGCKLIRGGSCFGEPPSYPSSQACSTSQSGFGRGNMQHQALGGGTTTGMGAVPPPGGNSCGNVAGGGGGSLRNQSGGGGLGLEPGRYVIKVVSGGSSIPFSGVTDAGGYFFIPLIPEGEPFTAIAFDTMTSETRTFEGIGPPTGESVFMFFDFLSEDESAGIEIQFEEVVSGTIESAGEVDIYFFSGNAGDEVRLSITTTSGELYPYLQLYGPDGTLICQGSAVFDCSLEQTGTYSLLVSDTGADDTGDYALYLQNIYDPANITPIDFSQIVSGVISPTVDVDVYTFDGNAGDEVRLSMTTTSGGLNPNLRVYGPDGSELCAGSSSGQVRVLECSLEQTGTYSFLASDLFADETGDYEIYLQNIYDPANITPIGFSQIVSGVISPAVDVDVYTFDGNAGDEVRLSMTTTSGGLNPNLRVYGPDGSRLCGDSTLNQLQVVFNCSLEQTGTYSLLAQSSLPRETGDYELYLQNIYDPANITPIDFSQTVSGVISPAVDIDVYTFNGNAGDEVRLSMTSGELNPSLDLYGPDGNLICWDATQNQHLLVFECSLEQTGTYSLLVDDNRADDTGDYEIYLQNIYDPANITPIDFEQAVPGVIDPAADVDVYTFDGNAGDEVRLSMTPTSGELDPYLRLYGPDGSELCGGGGSGSQVRVLECSLEQTGTYSLLVDDNGADDTGDYEIYLQNIYDPANITPIDFEQAVPGVIDPAADVDVYTFDGNAGDEVRLSMTATSGELDPYLRLYGPDGTLICQLPTGDRECSLEQAGTYSLLVSDNGANDTGDYDLYLQNIYDPANITPIGFEQTVSGVISPAVDIDVYTFDGNAGDEVRLTTTSGELEPDLRLYGPDGTLICQSPYGFDCSLEQTGTYSLLVSDFGADETGNYDLTLENITNLANGAAPLGIERRVR